ncbi:hypothetical protein QWJ07_04325 [Frankia sp. RB7]|nr:hypothetical protein [Frankia sp. RB7]
MHFRQLILAASLIVAPASLAFIGITPANAFQSCRCTDIVFPSGVCSRYGNCTTLEMVAPGGTPKPIRSLKACPAKSQLLVCDFNSCTVTCSPPAKSG